MSDTIIRVDGLSKRYKLGVARQRQATLRDRLRHSFTKKDQDAKSREFWALNDVSFEVKCGDVLGVVGRNGAGKSTLLKILSRITEPTSGRVEIHGRVGSLLEVGTGFHPELSGRENVFLNGAILGMKKLEIERKFDEIVAFAEVEKFIDTPVKRYSSGMYVRLAFAVAAHLEPEILIVDEVLAVGDAAFQKKCLGKMGDVSRGGRTILFVSHNMGAITSLCNRGILFEKGAVVNSGTASQVAAAYQTSMYSTIDDISDLSTAQHYGTGKARFTSLKVIPLNGKGEAQLFFSTGQDLQVDVDIVGVNDISHANVCLVIYDSAGYRLIDANTAMQGAFLSLKGGETAQVRFHLQNLLLSPGTYLLGLWLGRGAVEDIDGILYATSVSVEPDPESLRHSEKFPGTYQCRFTHSMQVGNPLEEQSVAVV